MQIAKKIKQTGRILKRFIGSSFWRKRLVIFSIISSVILEIAMIWYLNKKIVGGDLLTLHYTIYGGVDLIGDRSGMFNLAYLGIAFILINIISAKFFSKSSVMLGKVILAVTPFLIIFIFSAVLLLINVNTQQMVF